MKSERLFDVMNELEDDLILDAKTPRHRARWQKAIAACLALALIAGGGRVLLGKDSADNFPSAREQFASRAEKSTGVSIRTEKNLPSVLNACSLTDLSEAEILNDWDTVIVEGTVTRIEHLRLDFGGKNGTEYRSLVWVEVEQVLRGDVRPGETIGILSPTVGQAEVWVEDTETVSQIYEGTHGIFMPYRYQSTDFWSQGQSTLYLKELADYGFPDGVRWAFLETEEGLCFSRMAFPSLARAKTLEELSSLLRAMLES